MSQINIKQIIGSSQGSILFLGTNSVVSEDFNNLNWNQSNNILYINGNLQIADGNQQSGYVLVSDDNGLATWTQSLSAGTGSAGQVSFWSGTSSQIGDNGLFWNNTDKRLGIGTTTPTEKLHIVGTSFIDEYTTNPFLVFRRANGTIASPTVVLSEQALGLIGGRGYNGTDFTSTSNAQIRLVADQTWTTTANGTKISLWTTENNTTVASERVTIKNNGNVGIGTSTPLTKLHLVGTGGTTFIVEGFTGALTTGLTMVFRRARGTEASPTAVLSNDVIGGVEARPHNGSTFLAASRVRATFRASENWSTTAQGTRIEFFTSENGTTTQSERLRIDHNGNVGIGTTTPTEKLDVNGNVKLNAFGSDIPLLINRRALGTEASPTAITTGQGLFVLQTQGYNGSAYQTARDNITITAAENWTTTANGTTMHFQVVTNGTTANRNALRIYNNTDIVFGSMAAIPSLGGYDKVIASQLETTGKLMNMLYTNDGTRNRRIGLFLDDVNNEYGFDFSKASGTDIPFVIKNAGIENFRITPTGNVGIGTTTPGDKLHIVGAYRADRFIDDTFGALFIGRKARGTETAPTNVLNGDTLLQLLGRGWVDGDFNTGARVSINLFADEDWTPTALGTAIRFTTTNNGSLSTTIKMTIKNDGKVGIGTQTPTELLEVNGNVKANRFLGVSDIQRMPFKQNTDIAHTGTLTNTIIASYLVPAGTFDANDILRFRLATSQTSNANVKTIRVYVNSSVSLVGATQIATRTLTSAVGSSLARDLVFNNSLSSQKIMNTSGNIADDEQNNNFSVTSTTIDFSVDQYFIVAVELADVTDTVTLRWLRSQILR